MKIIILIVKNIFFISKDLFETALIFLSAVLILEEIQPGIISSYFHISILMWIVGVSGFLSIFADDRKTFFQSDIMKFGFRKKTKTLLFISFFSFLIGFIVLYKLQGLDEESHFALAFIAGTVLLFWGLIFCLDTDQVVDDIIKEN